MHFRNYLQRRIESFYEPTELQTASPGRRLAGNLLESLIPFAGLFIFMVLITAQASSGSDAASNTGAAEALVLLLFPAALIGWVVWWIVCATQGQSPAKKMLSMYVLKDDGSRATFGTMLLREILVKQILVALLNIVTLGIFGLLAALWCLWDRDRQCLWDKITNTYVAYSPMGFKPQSASELWMRGEPLPAHRFAAEVQHVTPSQYAPPPPPSAFR